MNELRKYIKECNLVFTKTLNANDFCRVDFAGVENIPVNTQDSIKLIDIITSFNKLYVAFKKEYDKLEKINLGENVEVISFKKFHFNYENQDIREVILYINKPTFTKHNSTILYLREADGKIKPFISNNINPADKNYYKESVSIDEQFAKRYIDFFEKYETFLKAVNFLRNWEVFGDCVDYLYVDIDNQQENILNGLNKLRISICNGFCLIHIFINLGENFGIDYDKCEIILDKKKRQGTKEDYDYILNNILVNKENTRKKEKQSNKI